MPKSLTSAALSALVALTFAFPASAQTSIRTSLEKLDRNADGSISPDEITPLSRPYLERIARARRLSLDRPNTIERFVQAARTHHAIQNGVWGREIRPEGDATVKPFGAERDQELLPEFGLPNMKYPYTRADMDEAEQTLRRYDRNRDGFLDRREASRGRWTSRSPFEMDLNKDDRLSRLELAQRYARRRRLEDESDELYQKAKRTGLGVRATGPSAADRQRQQWWDDYGKLRYVASSVVSRFDQNRNGRLELSEVQAMGLAPGKVDKDRNGDISRDEMHAFLATLDGDAGDSPEGLPTWFYTLDANRDKQVAMSEFTEEWTDAKLREFTSLDLNNDGLLTEAEARQAKSIAGGGYRNERAELLPPKKTVISEIEVEEDYLIGDLNVELSLTHSHVSQLDCFLVGPDGQRIELFTEVGGSGDHFDKTVFDDESRYPITKMKAPFRGQYQPEGLVNRQPGLAHYKGKSVKGLWQLIIRGARNDRFGLVHHWALQVTPQDASGTTTLSQTASPGENPEANSKTADYLKPSIKTSREWPPRADSSDGEGKQLAEARANFYRRYIDAVKAKSQGDMSDEDWGRVKENIERKWNSLLEKKEKGFSKEAKMKQRDSGDKKKERSEKYLEKMQKKSVRKLEKTKQ